MGGLAMLLLSTPMTYATDVDTLKSAIGTQIKTEISAQKSQQKIDGLSTQTDQMLAEYRNVLMQTESIQIYNSQLEKLVISQQDEMASIDAQLVNIETTQREIVPLMLKMIDVMVEFVALDVPFLPDERQQRIGALQKLMERADVSLAEKYRRILEAYQVETEYGRTIEAYRGDLTLNDKKRTVDFLRIGRVSLYYLSLDGQQAGVWSDGWQVLDDSYRQAIEKGLKVAKKQLPPDLLVLPVKTGGEME
jgi:hypothetical protein